LNKKIGNTALSHSHHIQTFIDDIVDIFRVELVYRDPVHASTESASSSLPSPSTKSTAAFPAPYRTMALAAQTVTIVNKSGKIVKSSKHIVNIFNEAKLAYNEKKAELKAQRDAYFATQDAERIMRNRVEVMTIADENEVRSVASSRRSASARRDNDKSIRRKPVPGHGQDRPPAQRGVSDSFYTNDNRSSQTQKHHQRHSDKQQRPSPLQREVDRTPDGDDTSAIKELSRRHTDGMELTHGRKHSTRRASSLDGIDMDLAYGYLPPPAPTRKSEDELELRTKMTALQRLLDECNCVQHSVMATIENLQKNPEALAAVALTLGEISNVAMKMAPGALASMKGSFPAIIALLASPQFAIAAGVGVGVTIIAFGGYKIIKKIQARNEEARQLENGIAVKQITEEAAEQEEELVDELREISSIERWRRGIADAEIGSLGTSVDGELITPQATRTLVEEGRLTEADLKPPSSEAGRSHRRRKVKSTVSSSSKSKGPRSSTGTTKNKAPAAKQPSGIRMLFKGHSA
jgi:hypothetical protein